VYIIAASLQITIMAFMQSYRESEFFYLDKVPKSDSFHSFWNFLKVYTVYTYVFWRADYENDSESWRKFDFFMVKTIKNS